jgi:hypothetical protein
LTQPPFGAAKTIYRDQPIHVALVAAYPTRDQAHAELTVGLMDGPPYRGIWRLPEPYGGTVHVFTDHTAQDLEAAGWTREDT